MKKFLKTRFGAWVVAALVAGSLVQGTRLREAGSYARMQEQTVLIDTGGNGQGSGVVIERSNPQGTRVFVWTVNHVVENLTEVTVIKAIRSNGHRVGQSTFNAKVIGRDAAKDLALLWVDAPAGFFRAAEFAPDEPIEVGAPLTLVGNVLGDKFGDSVSTGIMSQSGFTPGHWELTDQAALAGYFGCSGGPIFRQHDKDVAGLTVGMVPGSGFIQFVPVRAISDFANGNGLSWAVRGDNCPSDVFLKALVLRDTHTQSFSVK